MTKVAEALCQLVHDYFNSVKSGGVECRIVVPGLTPAIAEQLHDALRRINLPSLLVVPDSIAPSHSKYRLRAEGLTSLRHGDMIIVAWPGEQSRIQDSVIGAGGAIRNSAFSDEWPWVDDGNEYFRFTGPFLNKLLPLWNTDDADQAWLTVIVRAIIRSTRASITRGPLFLEDVLSSFSSHLYPDLPSLREKFLFHAGIPRPGSTSDPAEWDSELLVRDMEALGKVVASARLEVDTRGDVLERLADIELPEPEARSFEQHVGNLLDGLSEKAEKQYRGVLTLRGCWSLGPVQWSTLTIERLRRLFDPAADAGNVSLAVRVNSGTAVISADQRKAVVFEGGTLDVTATYDGLPEDKISASRVVIARGARKLREVTCSHTRCTIDASLSYDEIFRATGARKQLIRVQVRIENSIVAEVRLAVFPCGTNSPLLLVLDPGFSVFIASSVTEDKSEIERVEVSSPVSVTLLLSDPEGDAGLDIDDDTVQLVADESNPRILRLPSSLDPGGSPAGRFSVSAALDTVGIELEIEATDYERGDFTLERELTLRLSEGSSNKISRLINVFMGTANEPYGALGGLNEATRNRSQYARAFEIEDFRGLPVVADLLAAPSENQLVAQGWTVGRAGEIPSNRLQSARPSDHVEGLISNYQIARENVLSIVAKSARSGDERWPKYAALPVFVDRHRGIQEAALVAYLDAYLALLTFLGTSLESISWEEAFILSSLDCVVHWDEGSLSARAALLGPWHPLVVGKRFMVQASLLASARRFQSNKSTHRFNRLAMLLDQMNSLRWVPMLSPEGKSFDHAYVSATSDPGWLLAINANAVGNREVENLVVSIRHSLGLEAGMLPVAREQMASSYLTDFHNAYPTRRSIALAAAPLYSGQRIVESAEKVLYDADGPSRIGRMLPGGVHLFLGDADHIETLSHRSPHICIYSRSTESDWRKDYNDIHLLPPGQPRISRTDGREFGLSRGPGDLAAFYAPVRRVTVGAHGVPHSLAFERDTEPRDGSTVGDAFIRALHMAGTLGGTTMSTGWSIELPEELDYLWNVVPGGQIDPAVLVQYVNVGFSSGQARVLWDYSMSLTGAMNSYFVLSQVPESVAIALNGSPVLAGQPVGLELVRELSEVGLAVGSESLRSSTNALGVIGVVAAIRLFTGHNETPRPLRNGARSRGFLLPVDSFKEILGDGLDSPDGGNARRADLIAMQLKLAEPGGLHILFSAIECKYTSYTLPAEKISSALEQAARTSERLLELANAARHSSGIPERLALVALISFGLRLRACTDDSEVRTESEILKHLINGTFDVSLSGAGNVVVVTECQGDSGSWVRGKGMIIRLTPGHWPGIGDSPEVLGIQRQLSIQFGWQADGAPASEPVADRLPSPHAPSNDVDSTPTLVPVEQVDSPLPTAIPAGPVALRSVERLRPILLGTDSELRPITFDPQSERRPLDNYNMLISGSSGKGKTQLIKALVAQLRQQDRNVMMLDFKNDFASDRVFLELSHMDCRYVTFDGLPYNPLVPMPITHPATGTAVLQISQHISGISSVLAKTFGLGAQQESSLKDVIRECYRTRGLDPIGNIPYRDDLNFPDFNDIGEALRNNNPSAYNRMDPLFDLGVFSSANRLTTFEAVVSGSIVIDLSQIQSDTIKNAIAKLLVLSAHAYYNARPHSSIPRQFLVFDEAHRVLDSEFLVRFVRECRAYGVGVLLSSQYPTDFPQEVSASLNTKVVHGNGVERERVRDILRMLGGSVHETSVSQLGLFDAFVSSPHYHSIKIRTLSYPHYLLLMSLRTSSGIRRIDLQVDGIDTQRLSLPYLLDALIEMGLAVDDGGILRAV